MEKGGYIYILTTKKKSVLYTGVTSNLKKRIYQHKIEKGSIFTSRYNVNILVYYEQFPSIMEAIAREKIIKGLTRAKKEFLINKFNPGWLDLYAKLLD